MHLLNKKNYIGVLALIFCLNIFGAANENMQPHMQPQELDIFNAHHRRHFCEVYDGAAIFENLLIAKLEHPDHDNLWQQQQDNQNLPRVTVNDNQTIITLRHINMQAQQEIVAQNHRLTAAQCRQIRNYCYDATTHAQHAPLGLLIWRTDILPSFNRNILEQIHEQNIKEYKSAAFQGFCAGLLLQSMLYNKIPQYSLRLGFMQIYLPLALGLKKVKNAIEVENTSQALNWAAYTGCFFKGNMAGTATGFFAPKLISWLINKIG